ncbi:class I SAM-dependent methyltransferase [Propylenella binzhouense]|uniref:Class I SAM-dependent methyltransferase n=1 Tax=Propylenella binzhouense TaxID=2555902 RepID=A0A964T8B6_9HYPH|nr:class I SAM-dependent methyltransferase [Propylenella binzhouense]MYZ50411.1 class I SAM-dependent methyltransferase [Propylenella binzhouense]
MRPDAIYDRPDLYDRIVTPGPCEPFYRGLAAETGGPVLELACGTGRLTIPLAADGHEVVGVDLSPAMLDAAAGKARRAGAKVAFVCGDMERFALGRRFRLVLVSCNSLAHLRSNAAVLSCLARIRDHLAPGGRLAFDVVQPDLRALAACAGRGGRPARTWLPPGAPAVEERTTYDPVEQVRVSHWSLCRPDGSREPLRRLALRQFFPNEIPLLLGAAGLRLVARYGDFEGNPLGPGSANQVCVAAAGAG